MAWGQIFTKMRDPNIDNQAFLSSLTVDEGMLLMTQMKRELKNMASIQQENLKRVPLKSEGFKKKETYPMVMTYFEPLGLLIFAMVSKEIQLIKIRSQGQNKKCFEIVGSFKLDGVPTNIDVCE